MPDLTLQGSAAARGRRSQPVPPEPEEIRNDSLYRQIPLCSSHRLETAHLSLTRKLLSLLSRPEWVDIIGRGKEEVDTGVRGKTLDELAD